MFCCIRESKCVYEENRKCVRVSLMTMYGNSKNKSGKCSSDSCKGCRLENMGNKMSKVPLMNICNKNKK